MNNCQQEALNDWQTQFDAAAGVIVPEVTEPQNPVIDASVNAVASVVKLGWELWKKIAPGPKLTGDPKEDARRTQFWNDTAYLQYHDRGML